MVITEMTAPEAEQAFNEKVSEFAWYEALELVKGQIGWLEYVPEGEPLSAERAQIVRDCRKLFVTLRRLNAKYID